MGSFFFESAIYGSQLALIALGMTLSYGVSRFANVAQVEFATVGAYSLLVVAGVVGGLLAASVASIIFVGLLSVLIYHLLFKRLLQRGSATAMIGSLAVSILIRAAIQTFAGPNPVRLDLPLERGLNLLGALVTPTELMVIGVAAVTIVLTLLTIWLTPLGRAIRAVSTNEDLAAASGIDTKRLVNIVWFMGGVLGAIAGALLAVDTQIHLEMGFQLLLPVFAAAILGGFGSAGGAVVASYALAAAGVGLLRIDYGDLLGVESFMLPTGYRPAVAYVVLVLVLLLRPQGLFGRQVRRG